ncbi:MAG: DUF4340 domain-containing protein [Anaerolineales bacterium]|nr:DUF4340 domain-containing protein [Anaerolineales bacterium]
MARKVTPKLKKPVIRRSSRAAAKKPIIGLGTLVALVVLAAIILFGLLLNRQKESAAAEATPAPQQETLFIFNQSPETLSSIEVKPKTGETVKLARDEKKTWAFELPAKAEADQGQVEEAASQISSLRIVNTLDSTDLAIFGLDAPDYVITVKFVDGKTRALEIGSATPTNSGYYARVDKGKIIITDLSGIDALTNLAIFPPYLNTPTPEASATPLP